MAVCHSAAILSTICIHLFISLFSYLSGYIFLSTYQLQILNVCQYAIIL